MISDITLLRYFTAEIDQKSVYKNGYFGFFFNKLKNKIFEIQIWILKIKINQ